MIGSISFDTLSELCGSIAGVHDVACPMCGPDRRSKQNQKRAVLRIWYEPGFASWHCPRCAKSGWTRQDGAAIIAPEKRAQLRQAAADRDRDHADRQLDTARWLWRNRQPVANSPAARYLWYRGCKGPLPATLGFLPPSRPEHQPALIAAFGVPIEPGPGVLSIGADSIAGVHLTLLKPNGSGKAGTGRDKIMVGASTSTPIVLAPISDALALICCEGIETGLSLLEATGCGVWVAGSAGRLPELAERIPAYTDCITIPAEPDPAGMKGARELAARLTTRGVHCEVRALGMEAHAA